MPDYNNFKIEYGKTFTCTLSYDSPRKVEKEGKTFYYWGCEHNNQSGTFKCSAYLKKHIEKTGAKKGSNLMILMEKTDDGKTSYKVETIGTGVQPQEETESHTEYDDEPQTYPESTPAPVGQPKHNPALLHCMELAEKFTATRMIQNKDSFNDKDDMMRTFKAMSNDIYDYYRKNA